MVSIDYGIIFFYFMIVIGFGFWYQKRASKNLDSYFLAGKNIHWLPLAMSGSVSTFDITGTMWIVSILFVLGMKSMWHPWMWGVYMAGFFMAYMGKWVRRSNVMTAAEWMQTRFGDDKGGRLARTTYALMAVLTLASFIGYAYQGIGKFAFKVYNYAKIVLLNRDLLVEFTSENDSIKKVHIWKKHLLLNESINEKFFELGYGYFEASPENKYNSKYERAEGRAKRENKGIHDKTRFKTKIPLKPNALWISFGLGTGK